MQNDNRYIQQALLRIVHLRAGFLVLILAFANAAWSGSVVDSRIGELEFTSGYPTEATVDKLYDELDFQRAVQAYLWAMPFVSYAAATEASLDKGANNHTVIIQPNSAEQQQLILTGNQDTVYLSGALDLRDGPIVVELPAGLLGTMNNLWQEPLTDLGGPFSPEQNRGGRFLIVPPNYDSPLPKAHYHIVKSDTNSVLFYVRAVGRSRDDWPQLSEQMRQWKQYPLEQAANPPETKFVDITGRKHDTLIPKGSGYFELLARYINLNPSREQDMAMLGTLETLGIAHGREFKPDKRMQKIFAEAAVVGDAMAKTVGWTSRSPKENLYLVPGKRQWKWLFVLDNPWFRTDDYLVIDERTRFSYEAIGTANAMVLQAPGQGSVYIGAYQDGEGEWLSGEKHYTIRLPKDVPAAMFWSLTVYDNETRSQVQNELGRPLVGDVHGAIANSDGSFDLHFSPTLPDGVDKRNWVQTRPQEGWFVYLRLYGPGETFFDRSWLPGDVKRMN
jgi:hypothetical protein